MFSITGSACQDEDGLPLAFYDGPTHIGDLMLCPSGAACNNRDCMNAHFSPLSPSGGEERKAAPRASRPRQHCRYGDRCTRTGCDFLHPRRSPTEDQEIGSPCDPRASRPRQPCRYGDKCTRTGCYFLHPRRTTTEESPQRESASFLDAPYRTTAEEVEVEAEIFTEGARRTGTTGRPCKNGPGCRGKKSGACPFQH